MPARPGWEKAWQPHENRKINAKPAAKLACKSYHLNIIFLHYFNKLYDFKNLSEKTPAPPRLDTLSDRTGTEIKVGNKRDISAKIHLMANNNLCYISYINDC